MPCHPILPYTPGLVCVQPTVSDVPAKMPTHNDFTLPHLTVLMFSWGDREPQSHNEPVKLGFPILWHLGAIVRWCKAVMCERPHSNPAHQILGEILN